MSRLPLFVRRRRGIRSRCFRRRFGRSILGASLHRLEGDPERQPSYDNGYDRGYDSRGYGDQGHYRKKKKESWLSELFD
jgi:Zn-finger nucleic acid-binding protein